MEGIEVEHWLKRIVFDKCTDCGTDMEEDARMVKRVKIFCPNEDCPEFVRCYWRDR